MSRIVTLSEFPAAAYERRTSLRLQFIELLTIVLVIACTQASNRTSPRRGGVLGPEASIRSQHYYWQLLQIKEEESGTIRKEADEVDTTTTVLCITASTCENINSTITNNPEHWKVPAIVRIENVRTATSTDCDENDKKGCMGVIKIKEDLEPDDVFDFVGGEISTPHQQPYYTTGKEIRNIEGREAHDTYMDGYQNYVRRKRKIAKATRRWKAPTY